MKISLRTFLLNALIIANVLNGVVWEAFGIIIIAIFILYECKRKSTRIKQWRSIVFFVCVWVIYAVIQLNVLDLSVIQIIRLYGITKCICFPCIILLCFHGAAGKTDLLFSTLPTVIIITIIALSDFFLKTSFLSFSGLNYVGAIYIVLAIYVIKGMPEKYRLQKTVFLFLLICIVLLSGARSLLFAMILVMGYIFITEDNPKKRRLYFILIMVSVMVLTLLVAIYGFNYDFEEARGSSSIGSNIARALTVFTSEGRYDQARTDLRARAIMQFDGFSNTQKLFGSGDNRVNIGMVPVHNFFFEILLCYGIIGVILFFSFLIFQIRIVLKNSEDKKYAFVIIGISLLFGYVQPFITTGALYQIFIGFLFLSSMQKKGVYLSYSKRRKKDLIYGQNGDFK